ncbi:MAG: tRNA threonylcarbamoyladenosine biosynthesis protein TsaE [Myxococcota bacterium]|jgi:tRNA threonylcarbamoyladenosine biosynthesis protein TsaE
MWQVVCQDPEQTRALGLALGVSAPGGTIVALTGDLGAGKTCFGQGVGVGLAVEEPIVSPTFILIAEYEGRLPLLHADAYRLRPGEVAGIGLEESLEDWEGLALVEWAELVAEALPLDHLSVSIDIDGDTRRFTIHSNGPKSAAALAHWQAAHAG